VLIVNALAVHKGIRLVVLLCSERSDQLVYVSLLNGLFDDDPDY
jgi:hypothetical protein